MWICGNCTTEIEEQHSHCWNCGNKRLTSAQRGKPKVRPSAVPNFTPIETDAVPQVDRWFRFRGIRILFPLLLLGIVKILSSRFFGTYGLYIFIGLAVITMIFILWKFFRRDPDEGVGIDLH
jgi:hypothetical protein